VASMNGEIARHLRHPREDPRDDIAFVEFKLYPTASQSVDDVNPRVVSEQQSNSAAAAVGVSVGSVANRFRRCDVGALDNVSMTTINRPSSSSRHP